MTPNYKGQYREWELLLINLLRYLNEVGPSPITEIGNRLAIAHPKTKAILKEAFTKGLVVRETVDQAILTPQRYARMHAYVGFLYEITAKGQQLLHLYQGIDKLFPRI